MAFQSEAGHNNLPNGAFSPTIFSKNAQKRFRKSSTVQHITNTDYMGEIAQAGDSVQIIKEPHIRVSPLKRGTPLQSQALEDVDFTLIINMANYFQFALDDIEKAQSHINFQELASDEAGYQLRDAFDREVLGYMAGWTPDVTFDNYGRITNIDWSRRTAPTGTKADPLADADELLAKNKFDITTFGGTDIGADPEVTSVPLAATRGPGVIQSPLSVLNRINTRMAQANIPTENRWVVIDPVFAELLLDEDSKLVNSDWGGNGELLTNGVPTKVRGLRVYQSNNLPFLGNGPEVNASAGSETDFGVIVAGHDSAVATAEQLVKNQKFMNPLQFGDICRGMQLYGRKILRPDALFSVAYNLA